MEISLVIPAYNEEDYIADCIKSALAFDGFKEIIVVDNASTDRTADIARGFPGVSVVREENRGTGFARDRGFRESSGDLVAFVDADTRVRARWRAQVISAFVRDPNLVCLTGPYWFYDLPFITAQLLNLNWRLAYIGNLFTGPLVVGGNMVLRRETLEKMGGFNTSIVFYGDDIDISRRAARFGRVRFTFAIMIDSSGRRYRVSGVLRTLALYIRNAVVGAFHEHPEYTGGYEDIR
ncbi:MAG: glycosyltransferase [Patescibacteria group bacterium]|nr:glycosyltransferase [Patescibacteria group bacterium]MDE1966093.1 glycosyltransferase [Patescibacteria group bacterium]